MKETPVISKVSTQEYSPNNVFFCPEESYLYSQCIEKLILNHCTGKDSIVEFGTGEGSPIIRCLMNGNFEGLIQGHELNYLSYKQAQSRISQYRLKDRYIIHNNCFFENADKSANYLIANPPYLPAPDNEIYMPTLHGGLDGANITNRLLTMNYENALLMLSSYSNPIEVVNYSLSLGYKIVDFIASPLRFGYYSSEPKVIETITKLRKDFKAFYSENVYLLAGVLFKRNSYDNDLSSDFLKIITSLH